MFDEIRHTILYYLKDIGLPIVDGAIEVAETTDDLNLIFEEFVDNDKSKIKAYFEKNYNLYQTKVYPTSVAISSKLITSEGQNVSIVDGYVDNTISIESPIAEELYQNFTKIKVSESNTNLNIKDNDYIQVSQDSFFTIKKNNKLTEKYLRYNILFYLKNDLNELKSNHYSKKVSEIFDSNKSIIDEQNNKKSSLIYIESKIQSDVFVNHSVDSILRCTMLIKYY